MKKFLLTVAIILAVLPSITAQTKRYLQCDGVNMSNSLTESINILRSQGYMIIRLNRDSTFCELVRAGDRVALNTTPDKSALKMIIHRSEGSNYWPFLTGNYKKTKLNLMGFYGDPVKETKGFEGTNFEGSGVEYRSVVDGKCRYSCTFKASDGDIILSITIDPQYVPCVETIYMKK